MAKSKKNIIKLLCISILFLCSGCKKEQEVCYFGQDVFLGNAGDGMDTPIMYVDKDNDPITCHKVIHICPNKTTKEHFVTSTEEGYVSGDVRINSCHLKNSMGAGYSMGKRIDDGNLSYELDDTVFYFAPYSVFGYEIANHLKGETLDTPHSRITHIQGMERMVNAKPKNETRTEEVIVGDKVIYRRRKPKELW